MSAETRRERITAVLAGHPEGLSTPQIAELVGEDLQCRQRALTRAGDTLRDMQARGEVARCGFVPTAYHNVPTVVWRLVTVAPPSCDFDQFMVIIDAMVRDARGGDW